MSPRRVGLVGVLAIVLVAGAAVAANRALKDCLPVTLQLSSSTEKASGNPDAPKAMDLVVKDYNDAHREFGLGGEKGCATVRLSSVSSGTAERGLSSSDWTTVTGEQFKPHVWLPTSSAWVSLWQYEKPDTAPEGDDFESLAQSPLVLAMPREKAERFKAGLADAGLNFNWSVLGQLLEDGKPLQWGRPGLLSHGLPQWKGFSLRKDDPVESTSGLFALIAVSKAATNARVKEAELPEYLRRIERLVPNDIDPDGTQMMRDLRYESRCGLPDWGGRASAVIVQESLMYQYDANSLGGEPKNSTPCPSGSSGADAPDDLVPIYSTTNWVMDHPFVPLPGLTAAQRAAADDFLAFLSTPGAQERLANSGLRDRNGRRFPKLGLTELNERMGDAGVVLPESVTAPPGLAVQGREIAAIRDRWLASRKPVHLMVLIDESGTMAEDGSVAGRDRIAEVRSALQRAQAWLGRNDEFTIVGFAAKSRKHGGTKGPDERELCRNVCADPVRWEDFEQNRFESAVGNLKVRTADNDTPLFQAIMGAQQQVARRKAAAGRAGADDIYAVVVMTDGVDDYWGQSADDVLDNPREDIRSIPVYPVCFGITADEAEPLDRILKATTGLDSLSVGVAGTKGSLSGAFVSAFANAIRASY
ncbi:substrate-binding domain-containing protein [Actinoplanes sp. NPDC026623]|uniref:substrate-binding domain-containing protein n=1 Tax=Actinoplanes sp. NPDC026623 TaxID=3155610 RepID=UPI0033F76AFB